MIDCASAQEFLAKRLGTTVWDVEVLTGGDWSQAFGYQTEKGAFVARFGQHVEDYESDLAASRQTSARLPIPAVFEIGRAFDRSYCISARAYGQMLEALSAEELLAAVPAVLDLFDGLREARPISPDDSLTWGERLMRVDLESERVFGWHDRMMSSEFGTEKYDRALNFLSSRTNDLPIESFLIHNDLLHNNVLVQDRRIAGVIDWGCAMAGDHLYELATFTFYRPWFPSFAAIDWRELLHRHLTSRGVDVTEFGERLRTYETHLGLVGMAYCAFINDPTEFQRVARRTAEILEC